MAYNENIGIRIAQALAAREVDFVEKKMFGGLGFMVNDKMCCGVVKDELMLRVMEDRYEEVLEMPHVRPMDFTNRPMKGFVFVEPAGLENDAQIKQWLNLGLDFAENGVVKSKKKK